MNTFYLIVLAVVFFIVYASNVFAERIVKKKWSFKISLIGFSIMFFISLTMAKSSDILADLYVSTAVPHKWQEQVLSTQEVEDVVRNREKEGSFFLGFGNVNERETFRYAIVNEDGSRVRDKIYVSDCYILKAQGKKQKVLYLKNVRVYKNPEDKKFFQNSFDKTQGFYRIYLL